jgi:gluconolactonase
LGSDADAATGASQGRHGIQTLLAQKAVAELLATYLVLPPAEDRLYVAEWGSNRIAAFPIKAPGVIDIEYGWIFTYLNSGRGPDGMTMDEAGNLYAAHHSAGEVLVFNPRGFLYGAIKMPDDSMVPNNVQFHAGYLYITEADQHTVWRVKAKIPGIKHFQDQ